MAKNNENERPEDVSVPLVIGGTHLADVQHSTKQVAVERFYKDYINKGIIDPKPPYQRNAGLWSIKRQSNFMSALVNNIPIPPLYLCPRTAASKIFYPVDGLQRYTTLKNWFEGIVPLNLSVRVPGQAKPVSRKVTWKEIETNENYVDIKDRILSHSLHVVTLDYLILENQRLLFVAINSGLPLNEDENNYCSNFLTRKLLEILQEDVLQSIFDEYPGVFQNSVVNDTRFRAKRVVHELLMLTGFKAATGDDICRGLLLESELSSPQDKKRVENRANKLKKGDPKQVWDAQGLRKQERAETASLLHRFLASTGLDYNDSPADFRKRVDLKFLPVLREVLELVASIFAKNQNLGIEPSSIGGTGRLPRNIIDPVTFLYHKVRTKAVTVDDLKKRGQAVCGFLKEYFEQKATRGYKMSTSDAHMMTNKMNLMEELFSKRFK